MNRGKAVPYRGLPPFDLSLWEGSEKAHSGGAQHTGSSFSLLVFFFYQNGFWGFLFVVSVEWACFAQFPQDLYRFEFYRIFI